MKEKIELIKQQAQEALSQEISSERQLADIKVSFLGKNGQVTSLLKGMKDLPNEEKPLVGKLINELKSQIEEMFSVKEVEIAELALKEKIEKERIDVTLPVNKVTNGKHPISLVKDKTSFQSLIVYLFLIVNSFNIGLKS